MGISRIPEELHSVTPSLVVSLCGEAISFYEDTSGAEGVGERMTAPDWTVVHIEIKKRLRDRYG